MSNLSQIIENFSDWTKPWSFYKFVINNQDIGEIEKILFSKLYAEASKFELWNFPDLIVGAENSKTYLENNTDLSTKAIRQIVNAIAYEWK